MTVSGPWDVVGFWRAAGPGRWFLSDPGFDRLVGLRLGRAHEAAAQGELDSWLSGPTGALALVILLDQAPRNLFRKTWRAFATDEQARHVADVARVMGWDQRVPRQLRSFLYLPYEHSENLADQHLSCALFKAMRDKEGLKWAKVHRDIIEEFGRFPHRNPYLGRETTKKEARFMKEGGFNG